MTLRAGLVVSLAAAALACSRASPRAPAPVARTAAATARAPRWFLTERAAVVVDEAAPEHAEADEALAGGARVTLRAGEVLASHPSTEALLGFRLLPERLGGRYVLWSNSRTFVAPTFAGELRAVVDAPSRGGVRPWLDGVLLRTDAGVLELDPRSLATRPVGFVALADAMAIDARRGFRVDALGRADVTTDGGASWLDLEASRGELVDSFRVLDGGALRLHTSANASLDLDPRGELHLAAPLGRPARTYSASRSIPMPARGLASDRLAEAVVRGVPIDERRRERVLAGVDGKLAVVSLASGALVDELDLPDVGSNAKCQPLRLGEDLVVACTSSRGASVFTLRDGSGVFDLEASFGANDAFVFGGGDRFGHVGACGPPHRARASEAPAEEEPSDLAAAAEPLVARYCARLGPGSWIERDVYGAAADKIVRWVPGPAATVTAIASASELGKDARASSGVRLVRLDGADEKLDASALKSRSAAVVDADAWQEDDGSIATWFAGANGIFASVRIGSGGAIIKKPAPEGVGRMAVCGHFALATVAAHGDEPARALVSSDAGASYRPLDAPPPGLDALIADPRGCSDLGCAWDSGLVRVGDLAARFAQPAAPLAERPAGAVAPPRKSTSKLRLRCAPVREERVKAAEPPHAAPSPRPRLSFSTPLFGHKGGPVDVLVPFDARATPSQVTLPKLFQDASVAPILGARGVDILLFNREHAIRMSAPSASPWRFDGDATPRIAAESGGALVLFDPVHAVVEIARPGGVAVVARLVAVPVVDRTRLTLGRRADGRLAIAGYATSSDDLWSGALDLARGEVAPPVALASLDRAVDASRCHAAPDALSLILELPVSLTVEGAPGFESEPLGEVLVAADPRQLCVEAIEARALGDRFVVRFGSSAAASRFADGAPPREMRCALSVGAASP